jgi:hypothetical protein
MICAKYAIIILGRHVKQVAATGYIKRLGKVIQEYIYRIIEERPKVTR